ncbi:hypothetical protein GCM10022261_22690 [Brevibacterium daeguense]|uniref:Long-chain acyl-CoA synthetase n=1 Tax=Brevibacterium daeguense TaxID=909936 RepID=A0ABP8ELD1_9MICO|nr:AMP-binding protein [Brevibacterium daeguense]
MEDSAHSTRTPMKPFGESIRSPFASVREMWRSAIEAAPDSPFIHSFERTLTFAEVDERADRLAAALHRSGIGPDDRVAVYAQNDPLFVIGLLATWRLGGIVVPVNPMNTARELRYHLADSEARALITIPGLYDTVARDALDGSAVQVTVVGEHQRWVQENSAIRIETVPVPTELPAGVITAEAAYSSPGELPAEPGSGAADTAVLTYTSGTTGRPKGAMNTHGNLVFNAESYIEITGLQTGQPILGIAPLFHITGMVGHIMLAVRAHCPIVLSHRFNAEVMLETIRRRKPVLAVGAITALMALADSPARRDGDFDSLESVFSGGAPIAPALGDRLERVLGAYVHNVYGMSETASPTHAVPRGERAPVDPASGALSIGKPIYNTTCRVVAETGEDCRPGEYGEILSRGPQITPGYWHNPEATAQAFVDGFLRTGDVGFVDEQGWYYLVDRKKDMINASGYKVWPREVEDVLYSHPAVSEAAVVGVADAYRGETVKAFVTLKTGAQATEDELRDYCKANRAAYKYPRQIEVLDELPKTATGKILRRVLRD